MRTRTHMHTVILTNQPTHIPTTMPIPKHPTQPRTLALTAPSSTPMHFAEHHTGILGI